MFQLTERLISPNLGDLFCSANIKEMTRGFIDRSSTLIIFYKKLDQICLWIHTFSIVTNENSSL